jgi:hypothetical protein
MAWKLKKSKEDVAEPEEVLPRVVVTHGHDTGTVQTLTDDSDDFFASRVDEADDAIHGLNAARQSPFSDDLFMSDHPTPTQSDIPVIKSAFVSPELDDAIASNGTHSLDEPELMIERQPIDFGDVDFDADQEPETLNFASAPAQVEPELVVQRVIEPVPTPAPVEDLDKTILTSTPAAPSDDLDKTMVMNAPAPAEVDFDKTVTLTTAPAPEPIVAEAIAPEPIAVTPIAASPSIFPVPEPPKASKLPMPTKVVVKLGPFAAEQDLTAIGTEMLIGRRDYNTEDSPTISVDLDDAISRKHARILVLDGQCKIEDIGSTNGTKINGQPLMANVPMPFNIGDVVRVGDRTEITLK